MQRWLNSRVLAAGVTATGLLAYNHNTVFANSVVVEAPRSVQLNCSMLSPHCVGIANFFRLHGSEVKTVLSNPFSGNDFSAAVEGSPVPDLWKIIDVIKQHEVTSAFKPLATTEEKQWCEWVTRDFLPYLQVRAFRTPRETWDAVGHMVALHEAGAVPPLAIRLAAVPYRYLAAKVSRYNLKIEEDSVAVHRKLDEWVAALGNRHLMGGSSPNLADLYLYACLQSLGDVKTVREVLSQSSIADWHRHVQLALAAAAAAAKGDAPPHP
uniref:GST C-terminal domain-containing protein n=1 Tax=Cryptomonas curvata TaxID=233186 RepID=A0A7S0MC92_9CRYP|mmetsp:Transcript_30411/g.63629  ORF Transcript_30411/g.63629 Transcript_30411/m.63629 type:complete len:267 (+) Transcript_30411:3-803(+)